MAFIPRGRRRRATYDVTTDGVQTLVDAAADERVCLIIVETLEVFANGDGAQPTFTIGETGTADKFAAAADFTNSPQGEVQVFSGTLAADADLIVTATAGTGTATGAIKVTAVTLLAVHE